MLQQQHGHISDMRSVCGMQVVYATAVTKPGHGNMAPLAIGFTLFASAFVGTHFLHRPPCTQPLYRL